MVKPDPTKRPPKNRSVNDFSGDARALRGALANMGHQSAMMQNTPWSVSTTLSQALYEKREADTTVIDSIGTDLKISKDLPILKSVVISDPAMDEESMKEAMEIELRRLAVLKSYRIVGSGRNAAYERLVSLASRIFKCPISYISIIDLEKGHILAARGLGAMAKNEHERESSICARTVISDEDHMVIPDLSKNDEFKDHENVVGLPNLRFYAAAPLVCPEGYRLGTICVLDTEPRLDGLSLDMIQNLREIAGMIMDVMVEERERQNFEYRQPSQMIACTSNDLMTPLLGVVEGLSSIREDEALLDSLSIQQKEIFNTAFACSSVMNLICQKSLESYNKQRKKNSSLAVIEEEGKEAEPEESVLIIRDLVKHLHAVMDPFPKQVPLVITTDDAVPPVIVADDLKVFRSVVNYLTNACAKTETGSVHLKIFLNDEIEETSTVLGNIGEQSTHLCFSVEDTGCGIDVDQYQHLFKPVVTSTDEPDNSCTLTSLGGGNAAEPTPRTCLGLYSVASQISSIGGRYGFRPRGFSESGSQLTDSNGNELKGSVFWFSIPLVAPRDSARDSREALLDAADLQPKIHDVESNDMDLDEKGTIKVDESESNSQKRGYEDFERPESVGRKKRALIIEDSMVTRRSLSRILKKLGFHVVESVNGMEGLKELEANLFDIVLCDFLMPVMDGVDCVQQYRNFEVSHRPWFDQYIVGISAHANDADIERGMKVGMNDYRSKPVTMKQLEEILEGQEYQYVTTRLDSIAVHLEEDAADDTSKRQRAATENRQAPQNEQGMKVCLIVEEGNSVSDIAEKVAEENGWKAVVVHNGEASLRLLQMRNWDAVLLDDDLSGLTSCKVIENFRKWENKNRVNKQKNVYQVNSSFIPSNLEASSSVQVPSGFDGALGKPLSSKLFKEFLYNLSE